MDTPCKNCITYGMCRARLIDCLPEDYKSKDNDRVAFILSLAFLAYLEHKCCILKAHVESVLNEKKINYNHEDHDTIVYQILWEAFKL